MVENKIIRRSGIAKSMSFAALVQDFSELFAEMNNVSIENGENVLFIYIDSEKQRFIKLENTEDKGCRVSLHCGDGSIEGEDWVSLDGGDRGDRVAYSFVRTPYGAAFSTIPYNNDFNYLVPDGNIQTCFSVFEDGEGRQLNGVVFVNSPNDSGNSTTIYILTECHEKIEKNDVSRSFVGGNAEHTVLFNVVSYIKELTAPHLYKKLQSEEGKFGKIKLSGKNFISCSHLCLECGEV